MQEIATVYNKIFAVSYLPAQQAQQLTAQWQLRMGESDAFLVEAEPDEGFEVTVTALCQRIQEQQITVNSHEPCILAFFLDLRKQVDPELLRRIEAGIKKVLGCNVQAVFQFGYVGKLDLEDPVQQRANACTLVESNREFYAVQHRLCLVASPFLEGSGSSPWKSVCTYLDVLSRQNAPADLLPGSGSGCAGFLRYGEFNQKTYEALVSREQELTTILETGGAQKFEALLKDREQAVRSRVLTDFSIRGSCHPLHPDMFLDPGFWGRNHTRAKSGNHPGFNTARETTEQAVRMTGKRMEQDIARAYDAIVSNAQSILKELADAVPLGMALQENPSEMAKLLSPPGDSHWEPSPISLPFSETGYALEITAYLEKIRDYALGRQQQRFYEALQHVSGTLVDKAFQERKASLLKELKQLRNRLKQIYPPEAFCAKFGFAENLPESQFSPVTGAADSTKFLLCSGMLAQEMGQTMDGISAPVYCIADSEPDHAPLKGVQAVFLICDPGQTETVLYQLLPEVNL